MDIFARFGTDQTKEIEGVRHPIGGGAVVVVARWMNPAHAAASRICTAERELELEVGSDEDKDRIYGEIAAKAMAGTILTGFSGVKYAGEPLEYSAENAHQLLKLKDFRELIYQLATTRQHYAVSKAEATAKNS